MVTRSEKLKRGQVRRRWRCWVVGVSDSRPTLLSDPPSVSDLRELFISTVECHYHVGHREAEALIEQVGLRLALVPPDGELISYKRLNDLVVAAAA